MDPSDQEAVVDAVLSELITHPGRTSREVAETLHLPHEAVCEALGTLGDKDYIDGQLLIGDNSVMDGSNLSSTATGRMWHAQMNPLPAAGSAINESDEAWRALLDVAPAYSEFEEKATEVRNDFLVRGVYSSGASTRAARRIGALYGYDWDDKRRAFVRPWRDRLRLPAIIGVGVVTTIGAGVGSLTSTEAALAVTSAATAAAAFAALTAVALQKRR